MDWFQASILLYFSNFDMYKLSGQEIKCFGTNSPIFKCARCLLLTQTLSSDQTLTSTKNYPAKPTSMNWNGSLILLWCFQVCLLRGWIKVSHCLICCWIIMKFEDYRKPPFMSEFKRSPNSVCFQEVKVYSSLWLTFMDEIRHRKLIGHPWWIHFLLRWKQFLAIGLVTASKTMKYFYIGFH